MTNPQQSARGEWATGPATSPRPPAPLTTKPVWPFVLMAVFALPAGIAVRVLVGLLWGGSGVVGVTLAFIPLLVILAMLIGGITGAIMRARANTKVRVSTANAPARPIGYTTDGRPIYPVVGYTPDGRPVTADRAVGVQPRSYGTNSMATASLILAFFVPLLAVIFGHIARSQIRETGEQGDGMALAGLILGYLGLVGSIIAIVVLTAASQGSL